MPRLRGKQHSPPKNRAFKFFRAFIAFLLTETPKFYRRYRMYILGIETATMTGSVALITERALVAEETVNTKTTHAERLISAIDHVLAAAALPLREIDGIAVSAGPGSFTGLRIGVTTAKSLAYSLRKPIIAVSSLDALASQFLYSSLLICPILDARKKEVYTACYRNSGAQAQRISDYAVMSPDSLAQAIHEPALFLGDGVFAYRKQLEAALGERALFADPAHLLPRGSLVAKLGLDRLAAGERDDAFALTPRYLRKSDAEIHWEQRQIQPTT